MSMNEAVLAVAQAQQQGDAIPVDTPPMTQSAPGMGKPPVTPKTRVDTMEEPRLWPEIRQLIEDDIQNAPRELQREIGPSELGTDCVHCLAAKLAGWPERRSPAGCRSSHMRARAFRDHVPRAERGAGGQFRTRARTTCTVSRNGGARSTGSP